MQDKSASLSEFSLTVSRALQLLSSFNAGTPSLGLTELSLSLGISKAAVSRLLQALEMHRFVEQNRQTRKYRVGAEAFRVGALFRPRQNIEEVAADLMKALVAKTGFTSYISVLSQDAMVLTYAVEGSGPVRYSLPVGTQIALHASATGKAALAALSDLEVSTTLARTGMKECTPRTATEPRRLQADIDQIRACGYAINWEERTVGVGSVAAAILGRNKELLAVLSIGFATSQVARGDMPHLGERVLDKAREIASRLKVSAHTPPGSQKHEAAYDDDPVSA